MQVAIETSGRRHAFNTPFENAQAIVVPRGEYDMQESCTCCNSKHKHVSDLQSQRTNWDYASTDAINRLDVKK